MLRLRSDEQLVAQFRQGNDEAFSIIHDRYRQRLFAYTRQMFPGSRQDAEDAVQDVFVRAYSGLRSNDRELLALRAWLYRVAHNRCIDQLRRPPLPVPELLERVRSTVNDPIVEAEQRDSLRRLIADVRRLPEQQRSALLMRELGGMTYEELAGTLGVTVSAIKSLLVRARISLVLSAQSRDTPCCEIREELALAHDQGLRSSTMARRHLRDCTSCEDFRKQLRGTSRQFAALVPAFGPAGILANLLGIGGSGGAAATGAFGGGIAASGGATFISGGHILTLLAATAVATGGALGIQQTITGSAPAVRQASPRIAAPSTTATPPAGVVPAAQRSWAAPRAANHHAHLPVVVHSSVVTPSSSAPTAAPMLAPASSAAGSHTGSAATPTGASTAPAASNSGGTTASPTPAPAPAPAPTTTVSTPSGTPPPPSGGGAGSPIGSPSYTTPPYTPPATDGSGSGKPSVPGPSGSGTGSTDPSSTPSPTDFKLKMAAAPSAEPIGKTP